MSRRLCPFTVVTRGSSASDVARYLTQTLAPHHGNTWEHMVPFCLMASEAQFGRLSVSDCQRLCGKSWGNSEEIKHTCESGGSFSFCCWDRRRKHSWRVRGQTLYFLSLGTMWPEEHEGETEGYEREGGLLDFLVSLFFTLLHPSSHFWHWGKWADMFELYIFWPPGLPAASVWSVLVGTSAGSPLHHLPGLCPVCCFSQGPLVPSDPQWGALDGGDLLVAPVFVFPSPAVGPAKRLA